jgi:hypothetical protein
MKLFLIIVLLLCGSLSKVMAEVAFDGRELVEELRISGDPKQADYQAQVEQLAGGHVAMVAQVTKKPQHGYQVNFGIRNA